MTSNPKKHIIDAFLREIYGEKSAPDQTAEIRRRLLEKDQTLASDSKLGLGLGTDHLESDSVEPPVPLVSVKSEPVKVTSLNWVGVAAAILVGVGLVGAIIQIAQNRNPLVDQVAKEGGGEKDIAGLAAIEDADVEKKQKDKSGRPPAKGVDRSDLVKTDIGSIETGAKPKQPGRLQEQPGLTEPAKGIQAKRVFPERFAVGVAPTELGSILDQINSSLSENWRVNVIASRVPVEGSLWLERLFDCLLGRAPSDLDIARFSQDWESQEGRRRIVHQLVAYQDYSREFANHWADLFFLSLVSTHRVSLEEMGGSRGQPLRQFLRESFQKEKPWDQMVTELITAKGSMNPESALYKPEAEYIAIHGRNSTQLAAQFSRNFLGAEIQCAQCHDDSLYSLGRKDFFGLEAYLTGVKVSQKTGYAEVTESPINRKNLGRFYFDEQKVSIYAPPTIAGRETPLDPADPRSDLALAIVQSDQFSMTMVNWVWREIYGYGLSRPGRVKASINAPHRPLLTHLAEQWSASQFDFRTMIEWVVLADAFSAPGAPSSDTLAKDIPKFGGVPFFSYSYDKTKHDVKSAIAKLVKAYQAPAGLTLVGRLQLSPGTSPAEEVDPLNAVDDNVLPIELEVPDFAKGWGVEAAMVAVLDQIALSAKLEFQTKLEHVFMLGLKRKPNGMERSQAQQLLSSAGTVDVESEKQVLQDIWWAIYPR